jgi:hypothetical protein
MRVLHAPINIGNQPWVLSRYERRLGVDSELHVNYATGFGYHADKIISRNGGKSAADLRERLSAGLKSPWDYDVFHYYFGRTLLCWDDYVSGDDYRYLDLKIAKRLGKPVFFTLQGCDVRLAGESSKLSVSPCRSSACGIFAACLSQHDDRRRQFVADILPSADRVFYLNPELARYVPDGEFLPYSNVDIESIGVHPPKRDGPPIVVHAPSDPSIKGTRYIVEAIEALKQHRELEFVLVQNMTHAQALQVYQTADLVIDQVLAGWYGGFAVEAMAMGKPVLCYLRDEDFAYAPEEMIADLPIRNVHPNRLREDIAAALDRRSEWEKWSLHSRHFVEKWHNPRLIAEAMIELYKNPSATFTVVDYIREHRTGRRDAAMKTTADADRARHATA